MGIIEPAPSASPDTARVQDIGGTAYGVAFNGPGVLYVAAREKLIVLQRAALSPSISASLIHITAQNATTVTVAGTAGAIGGNGPLTVDVKNDTTGGVVTGLAVAANGSFTTSIAAAAGNVIHVTAHDRDANTATAIIGTVPAIITAPVLNGALVTVTAASATTAQVTGAAGAVTGGEAPVQLRITNTTTTIVYPALTVAANGSFSQIIAASGGHVLTAQATDKSARTSAVVSIGTVPATTLAPQIHASFISLSALSSASVQITATAGAVTDGTLPRSARVINTVTSAQADTAVAADGSFQVTLAAAAGQAVTLTVTDGASRVAGPVTLGNAPAYQPPVVTTSRISVTAASAIEARVTGAAGAVVGSGSGSHPLQIELRNTTTNAAEIITAATDGSFTLTIAAAEGNTLAITVTDAFGRITGPVPVGSVPAFTPAPQIVTSLVSMTATSSNSIVVTGAAGAVTGGELPRSARVVNTATTAVATGAIAADGSFSITLAAVAGEPVALSVTDAGERLAGPVSLGNAPAYTPPAPQVDMTKLVLTGDGALLATLTGAAGAVTGLAPLTVELRNTTAGMSAPAVTAGADGSFTTQIAASGGDSISIVLTDGDVGPLAVGHVPFGSGLTTQVIEGVDGDPSFLARSLASNGNVLVVSSQTTATDGESPSLVLYDLSNPAVPAFTRAVTLDAPVRAMTFGDALLPLYVAAGTLSAVDVHTGAVTPIDAAFTDASAVEASGPYLFVASDTEEAGRVRVYETTSAPEPRFLYEIPTLAKHSGYYRTLLAYGTDYLLALSPDAGAHDVAVLDRRDPNALQIVATLDIPSIAAFRGRLADKLLYVAGGNGGVAVVDLTNPLSPTWTATPTNGAARGLAVAGKRAVVAGDTAGLEFIDIESSGSTTAGDAEIGTAWDVLIGRNALYAVNELGLVTIKTPAIPPVITRAAISTPNSGNVNVTGPVASITGHAPIAVTVRNEKTALAVTAARAANGSFTATIAASSGDALTVTATDVAGRIATRSLGHVPFAPNSTATALTAVATGDATFSARRLGVDATRIVTTSGASLGSTVATSDQLVIPGGASYLTGSSGIEDVALDGTWAFTASAQFAAIDLSSPTPTAHTVAADQRLYSLAVDGNHAFAGGSGAIHIFDITTRTAPALLRKVPLATSATFRKLLVLDATHLVAVSPDGGHDVVVIDRTDLAALSVLADFDVPSFTASDATLDGTTLYLSGGDAGIVAVDLTDPDTPVVLGRLDTPGIARGLVRSGANELAVADGSCGITFVDTTDLSHLLLLGTQSLPGNAIDVKARSGELVAATETHVVRVLRP